MENYQRQRLNDLPSDDRDRGILTEADRKYLRGESDLDSKSHGERRARERIRKRVYHALLDFSLLLEGLQDRDRRMIFETNREWGEADYLELDTSEKIERAHEYRAFRSGIADAIGFIYQGTLTGRYGFEYYLDTGIARAENRVADEGKGVNTRIDFSVHRETAEKVDIPSVVERIQSGAFDELTEHELRDYAEVTAEMDEFGPEAIFEANVERYSTDHEDWKYPQEDSEDES